MLKIRREILIPFIILLAFVVLLQVIPAGNLTWLKVLLGIAAVVGAYFYMNLLFAKASGKNQDIIDRLQEELKEKRITLKEDESSTLMPVQPVESESKLDSVLMEKIGNLKSQLISKKEHIQKYYKQFQECTTFFENCKTDDETRDKNILRINDTHRILAQNIKKAYTISDNLSTDAKRAFEISENVQSGIEVVTDVLHDVSEKSRLLFLQSKKISKIIEIISDIASKTHILSINASIVSARAGKDGKAFEVVSKEIRKLANETDLSLGEIEEEIIKIQEIISKVVTGVSLANEETDKEKELLETVIGALQGVSLGVEAIRAVSMQADGKTLKQKDLTDEIINNYLAVIEKVDSLLAISTVSSDSFDLDSEIQTLENVGKSE